VTLPLLLLIMRARQVEGAFGDSEADSLFCGRVVFGYEGATESLRGERVLP
jgi:hypothetical protein